MPMPQGDYQYPAKITRVIDGDTYDVEVDLGFRIVARLPLRLAHVDAPERFTPEGKAVMRHISEVLGMLPAPVVVHTFKPVDKYGRYLADVYLPREDGWLSLAQDLMQRGMATPYEGGAKS